METMKGVLKIMHCIRCITTEWGNTETAHERAKKRLFKEANEDSKWNSDNRVGLYGAPQWLTYKVCEDYNEAMEYLENKDGFYWIGGCLYKEGKKTMLMLKYEYHC